MLNRTAVIAKQYPPFFKSLNRNPVYYVLFLSGFIGFALGLCYSTWQVAVESGQVIAGIVEYPVNSFHYIPLIKQFTIVNQLSALLLLITGSEKVVSIIISGLLGMISFQALSVFMFSINRDVGISILGVIFIFISNYNARFGVAYPIWLLGWPHTYGIIGLSFIVLVIALIGAKEYRLGLFCLGLAPAVHPVYGSWVFGIIGLAGIFKKSYIQKIIKTHYWYFIIGFGIAILSLLYELNLLSHLPIPLIDPQIKEKILYNYIKYFDFHRAKFYWSYENQGYKFFHVGVLIDLLSIIISLVGIYYFKMSESISFVLRVLLIAGILALILPIVTHLPQEYVPDFLLIAMPSRLINLNNIIFGALVLGILTSSENKKHMSNYLFFILFLFSGLLLHFSMSVWFMAVCIVTLWIIYLMNGGHQDGGVFDHRIVEFLNKRLSFLCKDGMANYMGALLVMLMAIMAAYAITGQTWLLPRSNFRDWSDPFYTKVSVRKGLLAVTSDFFMTSVRTRRPVLLEASSIDGFIVAPESGEILNNIMKKVYGIDILNPYQLYQHKSRPSGGIPLELYKDLWEKRSQEEWCNIRKEFGVTDVLTAGWRLNLPIVVRDEGRVLYTIPNSCFN